MAALDASHSGDSCQQKIKEKGFRMIGRQRQRQQQQVILLGVSSSTGLDGRHNSNNNNNTATIDRLQDLKLVILSLTLCM